MLIGLDLLLFFAIYFFHLPSANKHLCTLWLVLSIFLSALADAVLVYHQLLFILNVSAISVIPIHHKMWLSNCSS